MRRTDAALDPVSRSGRHSVSASALCFTPGADGLVDLRMAASMRARASYASHQRLRGFSPASRLAEMVALLLREAASICDLPRGNSSQRKQDGQTCSDWQKARPIERRIVPNSASHEFRVIVVKTESRVPRVRRKKVWDADICPLPDESRARNRQKALATITLFAPRSLPAMSCQVRLRVRVNHM